MKKIFEDYLGFEIAGFCYQQNDPSDFDTKGVQPGYNVRRPKNENDREIYEDVVVTIEEVFEFIYTRVPKYAK